MNLFNTIVIKIFDYLLYPFQGLDPLYGLLFISIISGIFLLYLFGLVSHQHKIRKIKDAVKAQMLAVVLYKDQIAISLKAQTKMFGLSFVYMSYAIVPLFVLMIPCIIILAQLNLRYNARAFNVGEETVVKVVLHDNASLYDAKLIDNTGFKKITPALRIKSRNEINWKIKAIKEGEYFIAIEGLDQKFEKLIKVGGFKQKLAAGQYSSFLMALLYPGEKNISKQSGVKEIVIKYPEVRYELFGFKMHWLVVFLIVSILAGLIAKPFLKVEI